MNNHLVAEKKGARIAAGVCMNCGFNPCCCAIPKWVAQRKNEHAGLPQGMRRFKKRPKGIAPK